MNRLGIVYPDAGVSYPAIWWTLALVGGLAAILVVVAFTDDSAKSASSAEAAEG